MGGYFALEAPLKAVRGLGSPADVDVARAVGLLQLGSQADVALDQDPEPESEPEPDLFGGSLVALAAAEFPAVHPGARGVPSFLVLLLQQIETRGAPWPRMPARNVFAGLR